MPTITPDTGVKRPNTDAEMTYLKKRNIEEAICHKPRKKDVYETEMKKIYNLIVVHTNYQLHEKAASDATFQAAKTCQDPIGYLMIPKELCFSNQYENQPIRSLWLATRKLYNIIKNANENTAKYLVSFRNVQKVN